MVLGPRPRIPETPHPSTTNLTPRPPAPLLPIITPLSPTFPTAAGVSATAIALGGDHTCALAANGGVKCWGWNFYGQLGIGSTSDQTRPVDVAGGTGAGGWGCLI